VYLKNGGRLAVAQQMAAHESTQTTGLYDRRSDEVSLDEVERCRAALKSRIASLYFSMLFRDLTTKSLHSNHGLVYLNSGQSYA
jgi:hypothetical protein